MLPHALLALEWRRFAPNTAFRMLVVFYVLFFGLLLWVAHLIGSNLSMSPMDYLFRDGTLWTFVAYLGSWLNFGLLGLCGVFLLTTDWTHRTLRQGIVFGLTRGDVANAKLIAAAALAAGAAAVFVIVSVITGLLLGGGVQWSGLDQAWPFFVQAFGCILAGLCIGTVIRSTAMATLAYLAWFFIAEALLRLLMVMTVARSRWLLFLPDKLLEALTPLPMPRMVDGAMRSQQLLAPLTVNEALLGAGVWIALGVVFLHWRLRTADV